MARRRSLTPADPKRGMTLDDLAEFVAEMRGHYELPGDTVVRATGMIEFDLDGPRVARITADPEAAR